MKRPTTAKKVSCWHVLSVHLNPYVPDSSVPYTSIFAQILLKHISETQVLDKAQNDHKTVE